MVTCILQCGVDSTCGCYQDRFKLEAEPLQDILLKAVSQQQLASIPFESKRYLRVPSKMYQDELSVVSVSPQSVNSARWRDTSRTVLAPLNVKQNSENIEMFSATPSRKRKADFQDVSVEPVKKIKRRNSQSSSTLPKDADLNDRYLFWKYDCQDSYVRLYDIFEEIPITEQKTKSITQNDFAQLLDMCNSKLPFKPSLSLTKPTIPIKIINNLNIPFSSDYGRRLLLKCPLLSEESALRRLERTEWYLKDSSEHRCLSPQETVDSNKTFSDNSHFYLFPKRQFHQNHTSLNKSFSEYVCKPLSVVLEKVDITALANKYKTKDSSSKLNTSDCVVLLERLLIDTKGTENKSTQCENVIDNQTEVTQSITVNIFEKAPTVSLQDCSSPMPNFEKVLNQCTNVFGEGAQAFNYLNLHYIHS